VRLVLASASPARRAVLRAAGVEPVVAVSGVDEDAIAATLAQPSPADLVTTLARAKADAVANAAAQRYPDAVVVGCDSMFTMDGPDGTVVVGKPGTTEVARQRWAGMSGSCGHLFTGHAVIRLIDGKPAASASGVRVTSVHFGQLTEPELEAYLASGEPLQVAGGFTLDGRGGWFVDGVTGDPSNVVGISLPLTRRLLTEVGISVVDLWPEQRFGSPEPGAS